MTSQIQLINKIGAFFEGHLSKPRFASEFLEQIDNFTEITERFPFVYLVVKGSNPSGYLTTYDIDLYCLDVIQKDRENINTIVSDCGLILMDFYVYFTQGTDTSLDILTPPLIENVNNQFCDYLAGGKLSMQIEVEMQSLCELPLAPFENANGLKTNNEAYLLGGTNMILLWK